MKKLTILILGLLLIGGVVATGIGVSFLPKEDKTQEISPSAKITLDTLGSNKIERSQLDCNGDICQQKMWKIMEDETTYNLGSIQIPQEYCSEFIGEEEEQTCSAWADYSDAELIIMAGDARVKRLEGSAEAIETRAEDKNEKSVEGAGKINLINKKEVKE